MAKWGRKGWRFGLFRGMSSDMWSGRSFRRTKTVNWGSGKPRNSTRSGARWGSRPSSGGSSGGWGSKPSSGGTGGGWGSRPSAGKAGGSWGSKPALFFFGRKPKRSAHISGWGSGTGERDVGTNPRRRLRSFLLLALVLMLVLAIPSFIYMEQNLRPPLMNIAKVRVKQVATQAINKAITEQVARTSETEKLIDWKMDGNGKVSGFMLNYGEHMSITSQTIQTVQSTLSEIQKIPEHIPIGHAINSAIISSFGPRVPVKFEPIGAVKVELGTRERNAGINMVLVEVFIHVTAEVTIIIPFDTEPELVETDIPISYLLVVGDVPMYYYDSTGKPVGEAAPQAPNISVPLSPGSGVSSNPSDRQSGGE